MARSFFGVTRSDYFFLRHRDSAAFFAIADRFFADRLAALALPPFNPPFRPICARYSLIGDRSFEDSFGSSSSVSAFVTSDGCLREVLEPVMKRVMTHHVVQIKLGNPSADSLVVDKIDRRFKRLVEGEDSGPLHRSSIRTGFTVGDCTGGVVLIPSSSGHRSERERPEEQMMRVQS